MVTLTDAERHKFAGWLRQEAASNEALAKQTKTMTGLESIAQLYRQKALAALIIAADLESVEAQTVGRPE